MFTKEQCSLMADAINYKIKAVKRDAVGRSPQFQALFGKELEEYDRLLFILKGVEHGVPQADAAKPEPANLSGQRGRSPA